MVDCGGCSCSSGVRVWIERQNQQLLSVRISAQKVPVFMEGLFFLFAVDLWTTMPQRPFLCCGFLCFSWPLVCSFDHSPFSHFPCSVSCVLCFHSSSYALFLTAGLMCYWTSTCGTRRLERQCVRVLEYVLRSKRAHLWLQGPSFLRGVTLPQAHIVACAPLFEAPWCGCITGLFWKQWRLWGPETPDQANLELICTRYWTFQACFEGKPIVVDGSVWLRWSCSNQRLAQDTRENLSQRSSDPALKMAFSIN